MAYIPDVPDFYDPYSMTKLGKSTDFWRGQKNPYEDYVKNTDQYAKDMLGGAMKANPLAGGWDAAMAKFTAGGGGYPKMTDPGTIKELGLRMANRRQGMTRELESAADTLSAQMAAKRGPVGGVPQESAAYKAAMDRIAGEYTGNYNRSMDELYKNAQLDLSSRSQAQSTLAEILKAQLGAGTTLNAQGLQGRQGIMDYLKTVGGAYDKDIGEYNRNILSLPDVKAKILKLAQEQQDRAEGRVEKDRLNSMLQSVMQAPFGMQTRNPWADSGWMMNYLVAKGILPPMSLMKGGGGGGKGAGGGADMDKIKKMIEEAMGAKGNQDPQFTKIFPARTSSAPVSPEPSYSEADSSEAEMIDNVMRQYKNTYSDEYTLPWDEEQPWPDTWLA